MKKILLPLMLTLVSCMSNDEKQVREHLDKSMNLATSNLEIDKIDIGKNVTATAEQKQNLALLGLKDSNGFPLTVTFKVKEDCVAIAEAIQNDVLFNEKKVSCRSVMAGVKPDLKYVQGYKFVGFGRKVSVYGEGKLIKAGETFSAKGELVHMTTFKDEIKSGTILQSLSKLN
jgi:hypothetical protein